MPCLVCLDSGIRCQSVICDLSSFSNVFSSETTKSIKFKFHIKTPYGRRTIVWSNGLGHMVIMTSTPIYISTVTYQVPWTSAFWLWRIFFFIKPLKNLQNQKADVHGTWHVTVEMCRLPNLFKFNVKVKFASLMNLVLNVSKI